MDRIRKTLNPLTVARGSNPAAAAAARAAAAAAAAMSSAGGGDSSSGGSRGWVKLLQGGVRGSSGSSSGGSGSSDGSNEVPWVGVSGEWLLKAGWKMPATYR